VEGSPFSEADIVEYARWFTQPGRATAGFNLYRTYATVDVEHWHTDRERILDLPTLWVHGMQDPFVPAGHLNLLSSTFTNLRIERFEECGHWMPEEAPERTASVLHDFLRELA
jgi:pimeloyl-ACP methyl ester carboxylesterase